jgi:hypothetical protein
MHMALAGGEPGLWLGFHESPATLRRMFAGRGTSPEETLGGRVELIECLAGADPIEKTLLDAERIIRERGIQRVVIDSMNELTTGADEAEREEAMRWLLRRLRALGVTTLLTQRLARVNGLNPLSEIAFARKLGRPVVAIQSWALRNRAGTDLGIVEAETAEEAVRAALSAAVVEPSSQERTEAADDVLDQPGVDHP